LHTIKDIEEQIRKFEDEGKRIFTTSSFQTHSIVLLHILNRFRFNIPVYFINTGFHFPETLQYKDKIAEKFGIDVVNLFPNVAKNLQTDSDGNLLFTFDPDYCCYLNKVQPVEGLVSKYDVWINGIRADQSEYRHKLSTFENVNPDTIRYHPLLYWEQEDIEQYINFYDLPAHPLDTYGYKSIGCEPCTRPANKLNDRNSRWFGMKKTECGLNLELIKKDKN